MTATANYRWRKSSQSSGEDTCVEVAHTLTAVRDSKNPTGPLLLVPVSAVRQLTARACQLGH